VPTDISDSGIDDVRKMGFPSFAILYQGGGGVNFFVVEGAISWDKAKGGILEPGLKNDASCSPKISARPRSVLLGPL